MKGRKKGRNEVRYYIEERKEMNDMEEGRKL